MANSETTKKRPAKPFTGVKDGKPFSKENQPTPEAKSRGWQELRKQRYLTQELVKTMLGETGEPTDNFKEFLKSLLNNAKLGNPKALDIITKCIEDEIVKVANVDTEGNTIQGTFKVEIVKPIE